MPQDPVASTTALLEPVSAASPDRLIGSRYRQRLGVLAVLLAAEWIPISSFLDTHRGGRMFFICAVTFACVFLSLGYMGAKGAIRRIANEIGEQPIAWKFLVAHFCAMATFLALSFVPLGNGISRLESALVVDIWFLAAGAGIVLAAVAFVPFKLWYEFARQSDYAWIPAAVVAVVAWKLIIPSQLLWGDPVWMVPTKLTFRLVQVLLRPLLAGLVADPATLTISSRDFAGTILPACSGVEGAGLMLVFSSCWLWFFRRDCRFPQALLLIPGSVLVIWLLNSVRIAGLMLLAAAGHPDIAIHGAHSQAGWVAFNFVAVGVCWVAGRVSWWSARDRVAAPAARTTGENPTALYLMPFIMILAAATVSRAATGNFEWLYPLRFFAAAGALWYFRSRYRQLDWRAGWLAPVVGTVVFLIWIAAERGPHASNGIAAAMATLPSLAKISWLSFRTLGAVITVPIAEELAFRGFLIRRLISADFEKLDFRRYTWLAVLISSVTFGAMHGERWLVGSIAGLLYAWVYLRRGRIGDAIVAHATSNALIAAAVLIAGKWYLW